MFPHSAFPSLLFYVGGLVTKLLPTLGDPMDYDLPGVSVHGFLTSGEYWSGLPFYFMLPSVIQKNFHGQLTLLVSVVPKKGLLIFSS